MSEWKRRSHAHQVVIHENIAAAPTGFIRLVERQRAANGGTLSAPPPRDGDDPEARPSENA